MGQTSPNGGASSQGWVPPRRESPAERGRRANEVGRRSLAPSREAQGRTRSGAEVHPVELGLTGISERSRRWSEEIKKDYSQKRLFFLPPLLFLGPSSRLAVMEKGQTILGIALFSRSAFDPDRVFFVKPSSTGRATAGAIVRPPASLDGARHLPPNSFGIRPLSIGDSYHGGAHPCREVRPFGKAHPRIARPPFEPGCILTY